MAAMAAAATAAVLAAANDWMADGIEHRRFPLGLAMLHRLSPGMMRSSVASLEYGIFWVGRALTFVSLFCPPLCHIVMFHVVFRQAVLLCAAS